MTDLVDRDKLTHIYKISKLNVNVKAIKKNQFHKIFIETKPTTFLGYYTTYQSLHPREGQLVHLDPLLPLICWGNDSALPPPYPELDIELAL